MKNILYVKLEKLVKTLWINALNDDEDKVLNILETVSTFVPLTIENNQLTEYIIFFNYHNLYNEIYKYATALDSTSTLMSLETIKMYSEYHEDIKCCYLNWANSIDILITHEEYKEWRILFLKKMKTNVSKNNMTKNYISILNFLDNYNDSTKIINSVNDI